MVDFVDDPEDPPAALFQDEFFPAVTQAEMHTRYRQNDNISEHISQQQLQNAIFLINRQLENWRIDQEAAGIETLAATGDENVWRYRNAVYAQTKAFLLRIYRDASATGISHERADGNDLSAADYERQAWSSVQEILGRESTVEVALL